MNITEIITKYVQSKGEMHNVLGAIIVRATEGEVFLVIPNDVIIKGQIIRRGQKHDEAELSYK